MSIERLLELIKTYNKEELDIIKKAYDYANALHNGQIRESGEPYIIHPLSVAYTLAEMHADRDTICAGLLHDTLEDTDTSFSEIERLFNHDVAVLVDGVTKLKRMNFDTKEEQNLANERKIITSFKTDPRIIIVKLADRLHNMRTLEFKKPEKRIDNARETLEIFVPLAYYIGAYRIKNELEDLSLKYLNPDDYNRTHDLRENIIYNNCSELNIMKINLGAELNLSNIETVIYTRFKNVYTIYKKMLEGYKPEEIHDLLALKVIVKNIEDCYRSLYYVHRLYKPINSRFKDYICNPKTNLYQSLHTTVFGSNGNLVQTQIRTKEMDIIDSYGLTGYWFINKGKAREEMIKDLREKSQFYRTILSLDNCFQSNKEFNESVREEVLQEMVYIYNTNGLVIELPKGSTVIDYAFKVLGDKAKSLIGCTVNEEEQDISYILKTKDRVKLIIKQDTNNINGEWLGSSNNASSLQRIIKLYK